MYIFNKFQSIIKSIQLKNMLLTFVFYNLLHYTHFILTIDKIK